VVYYGCARQTAAASIRRRTRTNGARGPCARRRAESVLRSASSGCSTRSRLRRKRVLMQKAPRAMHAQSTRHAWEAARGGRLTLGDMPMEARQDLPPATKADRILTKVRAARWRAVQDPTRCGGRRAANAPHTHGLEAREKTKTWPEQRQNNKETHNFGLGRCAHAVTLHAALRMLYVVYSTRLRAQQARNMRSS
jgi:hypothetical protein